MERRIKFDEHRFIKLWHLFYYLPSKSAWDNNAQLILDFKNNLKSATDYLVDCAIREIKGYCLGEEIFIIRALRSTEVRASSEQLSALDVLGRGVAAAIGGIYIPQLLMKKRVTVPLKSLGAKAREAELVDVYSVRDLGVSLDNRQIILLDDVVTTGATSRIITRAVLDRYPTAKINTFSLGWTPTPKQQMLLFEHETKGLVMNESRAIYRTRADIEAEAEESFVVL
jgi:hypothetical protein